MQHFNISKNILKGGFLTYSQPLSTSRGSDPDLQNKIVFDTFYARHATIMVKFPVVNTLVTTLLITHLFH